MRPDPLTSALRTIVSDLMKLPEGNRYFGEMLTGVGIRYDLGDDDPLVGTLAKDQLLTLADGGEERLYALMEKGGGLFVSPSERSLPPNVRHARTQDGPSMLRASRRLHRVDRRVVEFARRGARALVRGSRRRRVVAEDFSPGAPSRCAGGWCAT